MPKLRLDRKQLAAFLPNAEAIRAFEQVFDFTIATPTTIEEAAALAGAAAAVANLALNLLAEQVALLEQLSTAPAIMPAIEVGDFAPPSAPSQPADDFTPPTAPPAAVDVGVASTDLATVIALANNMRSALIANGIAT